MKFEETKAYKDILSGVNKSITLAYHSDTGTVITSDNIDFLINREIEYYKFKLNDIKNIGLDYKVPDIENIVKNRIKKLIENGSKYYEVKYAYLTSENILEATREIENKSDFVEWLTY